MNELILNYIVQAILGGASGYITNDYAINMLFKEYTPLKIGGVIKKTRQEFIENLSNLVEDDIINKEKLHSILSDETIKKEFENLTVDFYGNCLYEAVGNTIFANIDGFNSTIKSTDIFVAKIIDEHMPGLYKTFLHNLDIKSFLTDKQINTIATSLYHSLTSIINDSQIVENMLLSIYENNKKSSFSNLIDNNIYNTIIENTVDIILNEPEKHKDKIEDLLNTLGFTNAFQSGIEILYSKKIKDIINLDDNFLNNFNESLLTYINSEKGTTFISSLTNSLFTYAKESNKTVLELLDSSFEENLRMYIIDNIPSVTKNVVEWIIENSHLIDKLIEDSIDEVIKESDGLKAKLLSTIKNTYFNNLSKKYSIVDKIISYVNQITEPERLSINLSAKIINILNNLTIGEIVKEAENNNITSNSTARIILNYINKNSITLITKTAEYISNIEIRKLVPHELFNHEMKSIIIKELYHFSSSGKVKKYLSNKLINNNKYMLSKELNFLISEKQTKSIALEIKNFIKDKVIDNEKQLTEWIEHEIKSITQDITFKDLSSSAVIIINEKLLEYYKQSSENLKEIKLSIALDKLNAIDNLAINSSESIRSYAVKNSDIIIGGSIKAVVTDNLNKLNDDELVNLANDFIGRELRPIMYFGGILGMGAGIILAAFQSTPFDPARINIANMAVYAFVGYLTNVIAINMIFKPYKENKLLSKIPFLRNFSLGYIIKNQKTFAKNTAHFIDNSLLSKKSISMLFDKYKDKIKSSFTKSIAENDYKTFVSLLANNKNSIIKNIFTFIKNTFNSLSISSFIYNKLSHIKLCSLINENVINKITSLIKEKLQASNINHSIYKLIRSETLLESKLSKDNIKKFVVDGEISYYDKFNNIISNKSELRLFILKHENEYETFVDKKINEIIGSEKLENLAKLTGNKINSFVSNNNSRKQFISTGLKLINKVIDRNKTFEELFEGKFKNYVNSKTPILLERISTSIIGSIKKSKPKIAVMIQSEIKSHLGFIEKGMYTLIGGDELVDELLNKIIVVNVPKFMEEKRNEIQNIADNLMEERFFKAKVDVLYTGLNKLQLNDLLDSYLNKENSNKIENKINEITRNLFYKAGNIKLKNMLNQFNASSLENILNNYNNEMNSFTNELTSSMNNNKELVIEKMVNLTDSLVDDFMKVQYNKLFNGINIDDIKHILEKFMAELNKNDLDKIIYTSIEEVKNNLDVNVENLIDKNEFMESAEIYLTTLLKSSIFEKSYKEHIETVIDEALSINFNFIDNKTKDYILNIFTDSCILSLKRNLGEILKPFEFDEIAREEIENMAPEKIHKMFNSFGEKYFRRLILYGFGGFVFGINMYVGFTLTTLKILSELFHNNKLKQTD